jgi:hypothetical protein
MQQALHSGMKVDEFDGGELDAEPRAVAHHT